MLNDSVKYTRIILLYIFIYLEGEKYYSKMLFRNKANIAPIIQFFFCVCWILCVIRENHPLFRPVLGGGRHFFNRTSKSQEGLHLQETARQTEELQNDSYICGASIVEVTLSQFVKLWELGSGEVHKNIAATKNNQRIEISRFLYYYYL